MLKISLNSSFDVHPLDTYFTYYCVGMNERALAKEGLQKVFDRELEALADPKVQEEFLAHSATLLSHHSLPLYLQID